MEIKTALKPVERQDAAVPSVFDDFDAFERSLKIADALSKTAFVPPAFRGSRESCLVALDISRRLGMDVLSVFQNVYVIDSKPSFSTQFLIALVNRSGRYSRIQWDEGVDGEVEATWVEFDKRRNESRTERGTFPNFWAVAKFVEKETGEEIRSPRVDVKFALDNGWLTKNGSKWRTMPRVMCQYRAAAFLVRLNCPEITLGMDFAEDVADSVVDVQYVERPKRDERESLIEVYQKKLELAATVAELNEVGVEIKSIDATDEERDRLAETYRRRRELLNASRPAPAKKAAKKTAKKKPTIKEKFAEMIEAATDAEELENIREALEQSKESGDVDDATELEAQLETKVLEFPTPTGPVEAVADDFGDNPVEYFTRAADAAGDTVELAALAKRLEQAASAGRVSQDELINIGQYIDELYQRFA